MFEAKVKDMGTKIEKLETGMKTLYELSIRIAKKMNAPKVTISTQTRKSTLYKREEVAPLDTKVLNGLGKLRKLNTVEITNFTPHKRHSAQLVLDEDNAVTKVESSTRGSPRSRAKTNDETFTGRAALRRKSMSLLEMGKYGSLRAFASKNESSTKKESGNTSILSIESSSQMFETEPMPFGLFRFGRKSIDMTNMVTVRRPGGSATHKHSMTDDPRDQISDGTPLNLFGDEEIVFNDDSFVKENTMEKRYKTIARIGSQRENKSVNWISSIAGNSSGKRVKKKEGDETQRQKILKVDASLLFCDISPKLTPFPFVSIAQFCCLFILHRDLSLFFRFFSFCSCTLLLSGQ
eukprot:TRINITY_DN2037_c0_g1_i2.p1 TRINITY_DN2037_c0_g1~~TRINITY_DN2037_c0_g1_i2.p1  ORF type:complete len:350 (-),score=36.02 TRINITY_DN2037_c0_g1_i2:51-1100(-)